MNNNKYFLSLICLLLIALIITSIFIMPKTTYVSVFGDTQEYKSSAKALSIIEANSLRKIANKNGDERLAMASTTKIMTGLVAIENCKNLDEKVVIDKRAIGVEGSSIYLRDTDSLTVRDLLYGLLLASGNDASVALASHICNQNIEEFVDLMNKKAQDIGASNTHFTNPHGLDQSEHYTTANDLALISAYAIKNPIFKEICSTKIKQIPGNVEVGNRFLRNKQKLLHTNDDYIGIKTGYTDNAGRCNVAAIEKNNMIMICVVLNCSNMFEECDKALTSVMSDYSMKQIVPEYNFVTSISVTDGSKEKVRVFSRKQFEYPLTEQEVENIDIRYENLNLVQAPVEKEQIVGQMEIYLNNDLIFSQELCTIDEVESTKLSDKIKSVLDNWFVE